jgi:hypothetical protein
MAIINPLTYTIANGDPVDATPVQANFSQIVQDVNANAAPVGGNASQEFLVAPTANPAGAVPLAQAQQQFAALNGSASNQFAVANATASNQAVNLGQANGLYAPVAGNAAQTFAVANATASSQAVNWTQAGTQVLIPATSSTVTPVAFNTLVFTNFSAAGMITVNPGSFGGQRVRVYGCGYTVTVQPNVTSGSPFLAFPDGSTSYSWSIFGYNQAIDLVWDGLNWRATTTGQIVAAPASASNQVVTLGQLTNIHLTTPSRALSTTYYNTTGSTMWVWVTCQTYNSAPVYSVVNGYTINNGVTPNGSDVSAFFIVPNGGSYQVYIGQSNNGYITAWVEWY